LAGRGGGFAAGGGEAAGAGRAGGTVGIADFGTGFEAIAERAAVAEPVGGAVGDAADGAEGRLASADVAAAAGRVAEAVGAAELAGRVGAAAVGADPGADPEADLDAVDTGPGDADPAAEAVFDARAGANVEPVGVALIFAGAADVRGAVPAGGVCATAGFSAGADVGVEGAFAVEADADVDAALGVGVAGAAERVGGTGESPDPRSETSRIGEAQVPEYAASEGAPAHEPEVEVVVEAPGASTGPEAFAAAAANSADWGLVGFAATGLAACAEGAPATGGIPNPAGDLCESVAVGDLAAAAGVGV
jgi:hypothetical protein